MPRGRHGPETGKRQPGPALRPAAPLAPVFGVTATEARQVGAASAQRGPMRGEPAPRFAGDPRRPAPAPRGRRCTFTLFRRRLSTSWRLRGKQTPSPPEGTLSGSSSLPKTGKTRMFFSRWRDKQKGSRPDTEPLLGRKRKERRARSGRVSGSAPVPSWDREPSCGRRERRTVLGSTGLCTGSRGWETDRQRALAPRELTLQKQQLPVCALGSVL